MNTEWAQNRHRISVSLFNRAGPIKTNRELPPWNRNGKSLHGLQLGSNKWMWTHTRLQYNPASNSHGPLTLGPAGRNPIWAHFWARLKPTWAQHSNVGWNIGVLLKITLLIYFYMARVGFPAPQAAMMTSERWQLTWTESCDLDTKN